MEETIKDMKEDISTLYDGFFYNSKRIDNQKKDISLLYDSDAAIQKILANQDKSLPKPMSKEVREALYTGGYNRNKKRRTKKRKSKKKTRHMRR